MTHHRKPRRAAVPATNSVGAPIATPADRGADGEAMAARRSYLVPGADAGVECRQMADAGPLEGLRLDARHHDAAQALRALWRVSLAGMIRPTAYRHGVASDETADDATIAAAYRDYNDAIWAVQCNAGLRAVLVLKAVVIHQEPTGEAATLRAALNVLAMHLRL